MTLSDNSGTSAAAGTRYSIERSTSALYDHLLNTATTAVLDEYEALVEAVECAEYAQRLDFENNPNNERLKEALSRFAFTQPTKGTP